MVARRITAPGGIIPRLSARRLPENGAQVAANVSVLPGEWRPLRKPKFLWAPAVSADPIRSIYRLDDETWFAWPQRHVRVERAPIEGEARYVISGYGAPKIITKALATPVSASGLPGAARSLGVPTPGVAPTVGHSGGAGAAVSRFYVYTFVTDWQEESAPSPVSALTAGKVDGTWAISGMHDAPPNSGTVTAATAGVDTVTLTLSAPHYLRAGDETTIASVGGMTDVNGVWTITAVPAADQITVPCTTAQTYTSGGTWARPYPWGPCTKRLYRTAGTAAGFQLVAEGITGTTYNDTLLDAAILGSDLLTEGWVPPPTDLTGIISMPNGMLVGFVDGGRALRFCEPFQAHAWPERYKRVLPDDIVGIAAFDINLAVVTTGVPHLLTGTDPAAMSPKKFEKPFPGLSRASVISTSDGALFATKNGLARIDLGGVAVFTEPLFLPEQWNALQPADIGCAFDGNRLFISTPVEHRMFTLNMVDGGAMVTAYQRMECMTADPQTGDLYFVVGASAYRFDSFDTAPSVMDWMSRQHVEPKPFNLGAAKVEWDTAYYAEAEAALAAEAAGIIAGNQAIMATTMGGRGALNARAINMIEINGSILAPPPDTTPSVAFTLYIGDVVVFTGRITDQRGFRLPGGYRADRWAIRLQANTQISAVVLGDTPKALAEA